jgi:uncharacterized protein YcbK (DUF882 family)
MKQFLKAILSFSIFPILMVGCSSNPDKGSMSGHRIYIPQEKVIYNRHIEPKTIPYAYNTWSTVITNLQEIREYEKFLEKNNVGNIIPSYELLRTARDWEKCGSSEYMVPNRELWPNQVPTLRVFKYLIASNILTDFTVTSVYRDLPLNKCAGGANSSRHLFNSAIDFRIGPAVPKAEDYAYIENTKYHLCQFWRQYGQSLNMGLGLYSTGQIHIDTAGFRTWGPNLSRTSSMCSTN